MKGRRTAAMLGVLLVHALVVFALLKAQHDARATEPAEVFASLLFLMEQPEEPEAATPVARAALDNPAAPRLPADALDNPTDVVATNESASITERGFVDWPVEARESAARVLEREREAERIAKMFAGPDGTWAALTKRQRSELSKFEWAPGVDGLERDENGQTIYRLKNGCAIVNFIFFGCPIGKAHVNDDMFDNMREYFDEQRLPRTDEGNGTEPESKRPPKWSKPLPDNRPNRD